MDDGRTRCVGGGGGVGDAAGGGRRGRVGATLSHSFQKRALESTFNVLPLCAQSRGD